MRIFHVVKYQNTIIHVKHSKCGKETTFPETCNSIVYGMSVTNTLKKKKIESTLYGKTKEHYEKDVFWVFLSYLRTKRVNTYKTPFMNIITKKLIFLVFLSLLRRKTPKCTQSTLYQTNEKKLRKRCIMSVLGLLR